MTSPPQCLADGSSFERTAVSQGLQNVQVTEGKVIVAGRDVYYFQAQGVDLPSVLKSIPNFRKIHLDILGRATPNTGVWFLECKHFVLWLEPDGVLKILWGSGIPGAGKTVLASIVINALEARAKASTSQISVGYIYIRYSDHTNATVRSFLEALVKQTVERHPSCMPLFDELYARHIREETEPTEQELLGLLQQFTETASATFYILDALDEAPVKVQVDLLKKLGSLNVKLFVTSRPLKAVEAQFPDAHSFVIAAQEQDLDLHIARQMSCSPHLHALLEGASASWKAELVSTIKSKCGGMFLHASLHLDALGECTSIYDMRKTLESFPARIEDVYIQTWGRILNQPQDHVLLAKRVLLWVLNATGSLTMDQVRRAVATSPESHRFHEERLVPEAILIDICRGLVTVDQESRFVRLVHDTARDVLEPLIMETFPQPHSLIAGACMSRLVHCGFQNTALGSSEGFEAALLADSLLAYAHNEWATHARKSLHVASTTVQLAEFVAGCYAFPVLLRDGFWNRFDLLEPLHVAAFFDLPLSFAGSDYLEIPNLPTWTEGTPPLCLACFQNSSAAVKELLHLPLIRVNGTDPDGWTALMNACRYGHEGPAKLLLDHPDIQVNYQDKDGWTALTLAISKGYEAIVALLLAHPQTQVNLKKITGSTPLMEASSQDRRGIVRRLLDHPETDVNLMDERGLTALAWASLNGSLKSVELLLAHPATKVNLADKEGWTPLIHAACNGQKDAIVLLLLHHQIDVNWTSDTGSTALMEALGYSHVRTAELLAVDPRTKVNLADEDGWTAVTWAARYGGEAVLAALLNAHLDADVTTPDKEGWTPLMRASRYGHWGIVKLLLDRFQIDVNHANFDGVTALMWAARFGHHDTVKCLLVDPLIDVNFTDTSEWTALMLASRYGHEDTVSLLLACSQIAVNLADRYGMTALMSASQNGREGVVKVLLTHPNIDTNVKNAYGGWTALMLAIRYGHEGVVRLLLCHPGTSTDQANDYGVTALALAEEHNHTAMVRMLLPRPFAARAWEL